MLLPPRTSIRSITGSISRFGWTDLSKRGYSARSFEPLRILFCGSDIFSIVSLNALQVASKENPGFIESIDVVVRPGKWTGPYKKIYKEVPVAANARSLGLPVHSIDTFRGWQPPTERAINLIVAVSFGLLIPRRIIEGSKYGGLNVHPSLLPDLWGPAPLQHSLLDNDRETGITVQTLHPTTMDKGVILAQSSFILEERMKASFLALTDHAALLGANLLVDTLKKGLFTSPTVDLTPQAILNLRGHKPRHGRKLGIEDRHIDWKTWSAEKIVRYSRLLGKLWNTIESSIGTIKIIWDEVILAGDNMAVAQSWDRLLKENEGLQIGSSNCSGLAFMITNDEKMFALAADGEWLQITRCTVAGEKMSSVRHVAEKYRLLEEPMNGVRKLSMPFG